MKAKHDLECGARESRKCDCRQGQERHIKQRAAKRLKRQRMKIAVEIGVPYDQTLLERCLGIDWHHRSSDDCIVGKLTFGEFCRRGEEGGERDGLCEEGTDG